MGERERETLLSSGMRCSLSAWMEAVGGCSSADTVVPSSQIFNGVLAQSGVGVVRIAEGASL